MVKEVTLIHEMDTETGRVQVPQVGDVYNVSGELVRISEVTDAFIGDFDGYKVQYRCLVTTDTRDADAIADDLATKIFESDSISQNEIKRYILEGLATRA